MSVDLDTEELLMFATVLEEEPWPQKQPWFPHLRDEVSRARRTP